MQQAKQIQEMLKKGSPFEILATQHDQSPFREKGGDWGVMVSAREIRTKTYAKQLLDSKKERFRNHSQ